VVTHEQIEKSYGKSLSQILTEQTGLLINGANSNPGKDKSVFLRGASNKYTLILLDGIPVNDPAGFGGAVDLRLFPVDQIDHIEILKGSQSTLYGSDAIAGVLISSAASRAIGK
jgi:vitamin B12 transporter